MRLVSAMAIALEFIDFIVPISTIREKYAGGWEQCLTDHAVLIGERVWYDDHLLRDGAMSPMAIASLVDEWESLGFQTTEIIEGERVWKDVCVVESMFGGSTLACGWLEFDPEQRMAYLKGTSPGEIVGRETFRQKDT